jgi:GTP-binding protein
MEATADEIDPETKMKLTIVGRRNVGKSTFVNTLAKGRRMIVSEVPGTTRDSVDVRFELEGRTFIAIDTAGMRKRKSAEDDVEYYSMHRTLRSIRRADVVLLLIDSTGPISQVDKKLGKEIADHFKPVVIVLNKWDLVEEKINLDEYLDYVSENLRGLDFAPIARISAKQGEGIEDVMHMAIALHEQASARVTTGELNGVLKQIMAQRGPSSKLGKRARIYYATQPAANPPTIVLFVNDPDIFGEQYQRYMINCFRETLPFEEVPIKLAIRGRKRRDMQRDEQPIAEG